MPITSEESLLLVLLSGRISSSFSSSYPPSLPRHTHTHTHTHSLPPCSSLFIFVSPFFRKSVWAADIIILTHFFNSTVRAK